MHLGFAPQTRGSAQRGQLVEAEIAVCPADAGVYLRSVITPLAPTRLPRRRGGLPYPDEPVEVLNQFAPQTRGSTAEA